MAVPMAGDVVRTDRRRHALLRLRLARARWWPAARAFRSHRRRPPSTSGPSGRVATGPAAAAV